MNKKTVLELMGIMEISDDATMGQNTLLLCIDVFITRFPSTDPTRCRREYIELKQKHRSLTKEKLRTVVGSLTENVVENIRKRQTEKERWDRIQIEDADELLDIFLEERVEKLQKYIYRRFPDKKYENTHSLFSYEDARLAGVLANLLDLTQQAEQYLLETMPTNHRKVLR